MFQNDSSALLDDDEAIDMDGFCRISYQQMDDVEDQLSYQQKIMALEWIAYRIIGPIVVGIGLLGNVLNLIVLTRPSLKGVTYSYLIGLALSDLGVLLCAIPMMIRLTLHHEQQYIWLISFFYSHLELPMSNFFMASSIFIVVCLTVDRFASVCLPTKFKSVHTAENARTAIISSYVVAFFLSVPLGALKTMCTVPLSVNSSTSSSLYMDGMETEQLTTASPSRDSQSLNASHATYFYKFVENKPITKSLEWNLYLYFEAIVVRFGPSCVLAILNILIIRKFRQISEKRRVMLSGNGDCTITCDQLLLRGEKISKKIYKEEKRLVVILTAIVILFFVTTTPAAFLSIFYSEALDHNFPFQIFRAAANDLELCNFALNFYVYFLCSKEFRKKFLSFFTCLLPKKAKTNFQSITMAEMSNNRAITKTAVRDV